MGARVSPGITPGRDHLAEDPDMKLHIMFKRLLCRAYCVGDEGASIKSAPSASIWNLT